MSDRNEVKSKKRFSGKTTNRQGAGKVKSTIHLSAEASQRLSIHCAMLSMDRSELVETLIQTHCRRFVVSDRGAASEEVVGEAE